MASWVAVRFWGRAQLRSGGGVFISKRDFGSSTSSGAIMLETSNGGTDGVSLVWVEAVLALQHQEAAALFGLEHAASDGKGGDIHFTIGWDKGAGTDITLLDRKYFCVWQGNSDQWIWKRNF